MNDNKEHQQIDREDVTGTEPWTSIELRSLALKGLFIIATFYTLYFARALLLPFVLAFLLNFLLRPLIRGLKRVYIPEQVGAAMVLLVLLGAMAYGSIILIRPAADWIAKAPESFYEIESKVGFLRKPFEGVNRALDEIKKMTTVGSEKKQEVEIKPSVIPNVLLTGTQEILAKSSVMFILLYFLLASGDLFVRKLVKVLPELHRKKQIVEITHELEQHISRYLFTVTVINACMGASLGISLYLIGMPNAVLWGVMAGFFVYLPYIGPLIGITIVTIAAFLTFESLGRVILVPAIYLALETIQGQLVTPVVLGYRFALNPVVIFIWLIFWAWMWGIVGAILAFPMLTVLKILCDHIEPLAPIGEFLGR